MTTWTLWYGPKAQVDSRLEMGQLVIRGFRQVLGDLSEPHLPGT